MQLRASQLKEPDFNQSSIILNGNANKIISFQENVEIQGLIAVTSITFFLENDEIYTCQPSEFVEVVLPQS